MIEYTYPTRNTPEGVMVTSLDILEASIDALLSEIGTLTKRLDPAMKPKPDTDSSNSAVGPQASSNSYLVNRIETLTGRVRVGNQQLKIIQELLEV